MKSRDFLLTAAFSCILADSYKVKLRNQRQILSPLIMNKNRSKRSNGNWKASKKMMIVECDR